MTAERAKHPATADLAGKRMIGRRYVLEQGLGQGAMGQVFRAFDTVEQQVVALKLLKSGDSERSVFLFKQEFREAAALRHPNLVSVYDFGIDTEGPFFTMELVDGEVLVTGEPMPYQRVCDIVAQILLAVEFLHSRGKLHRDLKPENIGFTSDGGLKVLDLGLLEPIGVHHSGELTGTLTYMPPEVFTGKPLSATADLYSIGVMAYELLTGKPPFEQSQASDLIQAHMRQVPVPLDERVPGLPAELSGVLMALLAKDPGDRPQRAGDVLAALAPWITESRMADARRQAYTYLLAPGLVGRNAEMTALVEAAHGTLDGRGSAFVVGASPGVGKSRLVDELRTRCQLENLPFVSARCTFEGVGAYGAIRMLIKSLLPLVAAPVRKKYASLLAYLLPDQFASKHAETYDVAMLNVAVSGLIAEVAAARPCVLYIDDLQWADGLSLKVFSYCLDVHRSAPILWLGTYRSEEVGPFHPVIQAVQEKVAQGLFLSPFERTEIDELVQGMLGTRQLPEGLLDLLTRTTLGNAFFIVEMMRYLVDRGHLRYENGLWRLRLPEDSVGIPESIETLVVSRLEGLSSEAQRLARLGAVLAEDIRPQVIDALAEMPEQVLLDAINELLQHQVWQSQDGIYRFVHDRIREGLYQDLGDEQRMDLHQSVAVRLQALSAPAASLAYHFVKGRDPVTAMRYMREAGRDAERIGAIHEAFRHWQQAADLLEAHPEWGMGDDLFELWLDIGMKCGFAVSSQAGEDALRKAFVRLEAIGQPYAVARGMELAIGLIKALPKAVREPILAALNKPIPYATPRGWKAKLPPNYLALVPLLIECYTWLAVCSNSNGNIEKALEANAKAQRLVPDKASWAWGVVMAAYAYTRVLEGKWDESIRTARMCFELLKNESHPNAISMACGALVLANNQTFQGEPIDHRYSEELRARSEQANLTEWQGMVQYAPMAHYTLIGDAVSAMKAIAEAEPYSKRCGRGTVLEREIFLAKARVHAILGEYDQALDVCHEGIRLDEVVRLPHFTTRFFEISGRVYLERGELDKAEFDYEHLIETETRLGIKFTVPEGHLGLSEIARQRGDLATAQAQLALAEAIIDDPSYRCEVKRIYLERQRGRLLMAQGRHEEALESLEKAMVICRAQNNKWQMAQTLVDKGHVLDGRGDREKAHAVWTGAEGLYRQLGIGHGARRAAALRGAATEVVASVPAARQADSHQLEILARFSEAVSQSRKVEDIHEILLAHAMDSVGGERGAILRVDGNRLEVLVSREGDTVSHNGGLHISRSVVRKVIDTDKPMMIADVLEDNSLSTKRSIMMQALRAMICVPIESEPDRLILYADRQGALETGFNQDHVHLLESLVRFGRIAMSNARMIEQADLRSERLNILNETSLLVSSSLDTDAILSSLLDQVLTLTGAEVALVLDAEAPYKPLGFRGNAQSAEECAISRSAVEKVVTGNEPLCVLDTESSDVLAMSYSVHSLGLKSIMCVPLMVQDNLLGVLYVSSRMSVRTFTDGDLEMLRAIGSHAALALHNARQFQQIQEKQSIEAELAIAHTIQQGFFPEVPRLAGIDLAGICRAAREVGGDFYDIVPLPDGRVALLLGDVSGKNVSAALYMAVARTALRMSLQYHPDPRGCLIAANALICQDIKDTSFITCFMGLYDPSTRRLQYAAAGHNLAMVLRQGAVKTLGGRGVPLGMDPGVFEAMLEGKEVMLEPEDLVMLFTDGVIEALSPEGAEFGEEGLFAALQAAAQPAQEVLSNLLGAIDAHVAGAPSWDDLTILAARVMP